MNNDDKALEEALNVNVEQPAAEPEPTPVVSKKVGAADIQDAKNTSNHVILPARSQSLGEYPEGADHFLGYIGLTKKSLVDINARLDLWQNWVAAEAWQKASDKERNKEGVTLSQITAQMTAWEEYCAEHFPGKTLEDINKEQYRIYGFLNNLADPLLAQYTIPYEKGLTNLSQRTSDVQGMNIYGLVPDPRNTKTFSLSELMRRSSMSASKSPYNYDLLLRNSYINLRYVKPSRLEVGELISDISKSVTGHVRTVSQNLPALSNVAAIRVIWKFLRDRILTCSVLDTSDFDELADVIRVTDSNVIAGGLLAQMYPQGVNFNLSCLGENNCGWNKRDIIDPTSLVINRKHLDTREESAVYANLQNYSRRYSREECMKLIKETDFQHDIQPVYNDDKTACFILGVPSLTESFEAEEFFTDLIKDKLQSIRESSMTEQRYFERRDEFLNGLVGTDYLHYVAEYHVLPTPGTDGKTVKYIRGESDPKEFNQGIVNIIQDNINMATGLVTAVITHYPFMSKTFVGMANYECEECKGKSASYEDLGYTPINIVSTFFTLASLTFTGQSKVGENAQAEALLAITK